MREKIQELQDQLEKKKQASPSEWSPNFIDHGFADFPDFRKLLTENENLREKCKKLEEALTANVFTSKLAGNLEVKILLQAKLELENEIESNKKEHQKEVKKLKDKIEELYKELGNSRMEINQLKSQLSEQKKSTARVSKRFSTIQPGEDQIGLSMSKATISLHKKQIEQLNEEIYDLKTIEKKQRIRIRQLEQELESSLRMMIKSQTNLNGKKPQFDTYQQQYNSTLVSQDLSKSHKGFPGSPQVIANSKPYRKGSESPRQTVFVKFRRDSPSPSIKPKNPLSIFEKRPLSALRDVVDDPGAPFGTERTPIKKVSWEQSSAPSSTRHNTQRIRSSSGCDDDFTNSKILHTSRSHKRIVSLHEVKQVLTRNDVLKADLIAEVHSRARINTTPKLSNVVATIHLLDDSEDSIDLRDIDARLGNAH